MTVVEEGHGNCRVSLLQRHLAPIFQYSLQHTDLHIDVRGALQSR